MAKRGILRVFQRWGPGGPTAPVERSAVSRSGFGVIMEAVLDPVKLQELARRGAESSRGYASAGPLRMQLTRESRAFLKKQGTATLKASDVPH